MESQLLLNNRAVFIAFSQDETYLLGEAIGKACYPGLTILLFGSLGMGKTLLTQGIGNQLGYKRIKSPTFILLSEHDGKLPLIHADLYRLESPAEADSLDFENYIEQGCLLVVEWAERWGSPPENDRLDIRFEPVRGDETARRITIEATGERAAVVLASAVSALRDLR